MLLMLWHLLTLKDWLLVLLKNVKEWIIDVLQDFNVDFSNCWKTESSNVKMFCSLIQINPFAILRENRPVSLLMNLTCELLMVGGNTDTEDHF